MERTCVCMSVWGRVCDLKFIRWFFINFIYSYSWRTWICKIYWFFVVVADFPFRAFEARSNKCILFRIIINFCSQTLNVLSMYTRVYVNWIVNIWSINMFALNRVTRSKCACECLHSLRVFSENECINCVSLTIRWLLLAAAKSQFLPRYRATNNRRIEKKRSKEIKWCDKKISSHAHLII